jgi:hypothetical protein
MRRREFIALRGWRGCLADTRMRNKQGSARSGRLKSDTAEKEAAQQGGLGCVHSCASYYLISHAVLCGMSIAV